MTRTALGIAFACLFATNSFANGFEVPSQPDYSLQRSTAGDSGVDRSLTTGSIKPVDQNAGDTREHKSHHHMWRKPVAGQQP